MKTQAILLLPFFLLFANSLQAHEIKKPGMGNLATAVFTVQNNAPLALESGEEAIQQGNPEAYDHPEKVRADFEDFPNLHPLFVHFPVVLLVVAAFFQIAAFFIFKGEISWVVLIMVLFGFIGGYIAISFAHPHVAHDLPEHARKVFEKHAMFARWTLWLSGIALLLKAGSHFFLKRVLWAEVIVTLVLLASAYTVSMAGHYGSQLVYIEGVGPLGKYLEEGHSHVH